ncbi:metallophosphoesterase [Brevibacillus ginsengisoli]|uniref:metallophosphoesterase n=1 Tax=Brevibacillus ginsengisoli TaxID=363854 RepID=UPI003CEE227F
MFIAAIGTSLLILFILVNTLYVKKRTYRFKANVKHPFRIVHISDLHGRIQYLNGSISSLVNHLNPDLLCITGDLTNKATQLPKVARELAKIQSRHGVFFVPGNYEREEMVYFRKRVIPEEHSYKRVVTYPITTLENSCKEVVIQGTKVLLFGFDNSIYGNEKYPPEIKEIENNFKLVLAHSPNIIHYVKEHQVSFDLLLTGHTHGGQVRLFSRTFGSYRHFHLGVIQTLGGYFGITRGLGTARLPIRINCFPEICVYEVERKS